MTDHDPHTTEAPAAPPLLALENVVRRYWQGETEVRVLGGASVTLHAGEVVALVAPSGAGKSTLLHVAGLLEKPDEGEVYVDGLPTVGLSDDERTAMRRDQVGFVYQFHHLLPEFTALENVVMPQLIRGLSPRESRERATDLLGYLGLGKRLSHRPSELSGGEQQRVAIARAVANAPRLLLADEPTGNLDPVTSAYVFKTLTTLARASGLAAIVATHNLDLADTLDRRITLRDGVLVDA